MAKQNQNESFSNSINLDAENDDFFEDDELAEDIVVEMTDAEGNVYYYVEEMIIPVGEDNFAILVGIPNEDGEEHHCHCGECGDDCECGDEDVIIAKIILNEDGEEEYIEPTDEEFEAVQEAYQALMNESEEF